MSAECVSKKPRFEAVVSAPAVFTAGATPPLRAKAFPNAQMPGADSPANGVSPESDDWSDAADEPILFSSPDRALTGAHEAFEASGISFAADATEGTRYGNSVSRPLLTTAITKTTGTTGTTGIATINTNAPKTTAVAPRHEREPRVHGAVTMLRSLRQLDMLVGTAPLPHSSNSSHSFESSAEHCDALRLRAGESALFVIHNGRASGRALFDAATAEHSQVRVFFLDLLALPPAEYEDPAWLYKDTHSFSFSSSSSAAVAAPHGSLRLSAMDRATEPPSLSSQIVHCTERVLRHVGDALRVDEILCPEEHQHQHQHTPSQASQASQATPTQTPTPNTNNNNNTNTKATPTPNTKAKATPTSTQKRGRGEELTLPALVLWQAEGAPSDEYAPSKAAGALGGGVFGRPLVVKQLTAVDQLHSLSLMPPVYTLEHLLRTVAKKAVVSCGVKDSRTLIYFGASWCPPCMRIVNALPAMLKEDIPSNVVCTVKADMDLATPIFEFFGVEIIPTFVVLDNDKLRSTGGWNTLFGGESALAESMNEFRESLRKSELGRIQCSQRLLVRAFIEKHCKGLSFDEDF